ncbi:hypothetical protein [Streptomyces flavofungini]|uniref:hypothetical protein n=1 Tax=Streptomyces flavofungini TaxID=68200 RepID=UPI0025AF4551|nr:hypothetical protein [Streptomyces flavofungini]WJV45663.1 hypothetical protein QUY26_09035 [Streptomyces flavofungini]
MIGRLELSDDGRALKRFELATFDVQLNVDTTLAAARLDGADAPPDGTGEAGKHSPKRTPR